MLNLYNFSDTELKIPISDIGLSTRATNCLAANGIETLSDLVDAIENDQLKLLRNMGKITIQEISNKIAQMQTKEYRDNAAALQDAEKKFADINKQIAEYNAIITKLNQQKKFCELQISALKNQKHKG